MNSPIDLSVVIPVYNEESVFDALADRMRGTMDASGLQCEVILVDDGSTDGTRQKIQQLCGSDSRFRGVFLSRNFGHQRAVSAGLDYVRGRHVGILDGDLQDPPETLLRFRQKLAEGYDVVYAVRQRRKETAVKRFCYWAFYRLLNCVATIDLPLDSGDFCLMTDRVVRQIRAMPERHRFVRGMRSWVGFRQIGVCYDRSARAAGQSKYTLSKLMLLALDGIFTFSEVPVRLATLAGVAVAAVSLLWGFRILMWRLFGDGTSVPGFATLGCGMFLLAGIQLICLGILGEYVARIHNEVKGRPVYVVDRLIGFDSPQPTTKSDADEQAALLEMQRMVGDMRRQLDCLAGSARDPAAANEWRTAADYPPRCPLCGAGRLTPPAKQLSAKMLGKPLPGAPPHFFG